MNFITLTDENGSPVQVNMDQVIYIKERSFAEGSVVRHVDGELYIKETPTQAVNQAYA